MEWPNESVDYKAYINILKEEVACSAIESLVRSDKVHVKVSDNTCEYLNVQNNSCQGQ